MKYFKSVFWVGILLIVLCQPQLKGEKKKTFKKYAKIMWTKNGEKWNPKDDGKDKLNGFVIRYSIAIEDH